MIRVDLRHIALFVGIAWVFSGLIIPQTGFTGTVTAQNGIAISDTVQSDGESLEIVDFGIVDNSDGAVEFDETYDVFVRVRNNGPEPLRTEVIYTFHGEDVIIDEIDLAPDEEREVLLRGANVRDFERDLGRDFGPGEYEHGALVESFDVDDAYDEVRGTLEVVESHAGPSDDRASEPVEILDFGIDNHPPPIMYGETYDVFVTLRHNGHEPIRVEVVYLFEDEDVIVEEVDLEPGEERDVIIRAANVREFEQHLGRTFGPGFYEHGIVIQSLGGGDVFTEDRRGLEVLESDGSLPAEDSSRHGREADGPRRGFFSNNDQQFLGPLADPFVLTVGGFVVSIGGIIHQMVSE